MTVSGYVRLTKLSANAKLASDAANVNDCLQICVGEFIARGRASRLEWRARKRRGKQTVDKENEQHFALIS